MKDKKNSNSKSILLAIILITFLLRLISFSIMSPPRLDPSKKLALIGDTDHYHSLAESIIKNKSFSFEGNIGHYPRTTGINISAKRTPGYPLFVALSYLIFGIKFWPVYLIQIILDALTVITTYLISRELFESKIPALIAAFLYSVHLASACFVNFIHSEILFTFVFSLSILLFIRALKSAKIKKFILIGFLLGVSTLIRPIALYSPLIIVFILLLKDKNFPLKSRIIASFIMVAAFLITISPWQYRNLKMFGHYSLTTQGGTNLCFWNARILKENLENIDSKTAINDLTNNLSIKTKNPFEQEKIYYKLGLAYILKHPLEYTYYHLKGIAAIMTSNVATTPEIGDFWKKNNISLFFIEKKIKPLLHLKTILEIIFFMASLFFILLKKQNKKYPLILLLIIFYILGTTGILGLNSKGILRFRIPIAPFYFSLSAWGATRFWYFLKNVLVSLKTRCKIQ